jgi:predicted nucleic acid-binding protein
MDVYYDTGALIPLYVNEIFSEVVTGYTAGCGVPIPFSLFHRLEFENALRLKLFRKEMDAERLKRILSDMGDDLASGRLTFRPVNWIDAFDRARSIGADVTAKTGCRTLDLIHVAIAVQWGCPTFLTADERQLAAAKMASLRTVDLRELHRRHGDDGGYSGVVREQQAKYGRSSRKRGSNRNT